MALTRLRVLQTLTAGATMPWWPTLAGAQQPAAIRAAMIPIEPAALIYYAADNGYFTSAGLDVEIAQNPSTPAIASAVASGTYDIAYGTISTLAVAHVHGLPFVIIAPGIGYIPGRITGAIMVPTTSTLQSGKDFNGKTLATAGLNTIAEYLPRAWIDKHGGDSTTIKFVEIPFPATGDAMASGRVDAAYMVEPFITIASKKGLARVLTPGDDAIAPIYTATGWYTTTDWAKAHPDAVARFTAAMLAAARWANANQAKVVPIIAKELHADPVLAAETSRPYFPEKLVPAQMQPWIDVTAHYAKFPTFPVEELIYVPPSR